MSITPGSKLSRCKCKSDHRIQCKSNALRSANVLIVTKAKAERAHAISKWVI